VGEETRSKTKIRLCKSRVSYSKLFKKRFQGVGEETEKKDLKRKGGQRRRRGRVLGAKKE